MDASIVKFYDAHVRPPRGGWNFMIGGELVQKHSEADIIDEVKRYRRNNGTFTSEDDISRELWAYWCSRQPERCGQSKKPEDTATRAIPTPRDLTPAVMGPWVWQFLNLAAARWTPMLHGWFLELCDTILVLLECPICRSEWSSILQRRSPARLETRLAVCQWVLWAHNEVNAKKGKPEYRYEQMILDYGAPTP